MKIDLFLKMWERVAEFCLAAVGMCDLRTDYRSGTRIHIVSELHISQYFVEKQEARPFWLRAEVV